MIIDNLAGIHGQQNTDKTRYNRSKNNGDNGNPPMRDWKKNLVPAC